MIVVAHRDVAVLQSGKVAVTEVKVDLNRVTGDFCHNTIYKNIFRSEDRSRSPVPKKARKSHSVSRSPKKSNRDTSRSKSRSESPRKSKRNASRSASRSPKRNRTKSRSPTPKDEKDRSASVEKDRKSRSRSRGSKVGIYIFFAFLCCRMERDPAVEALFIVPKAAIVLNRDLPAEAPRKMVMESIIQRVAVIHQLTTNRIEVWLF